MLPSNRNQSIDLLRLFPVFLQLSLRWSLRFFGTTKYYLKHVFDSLRNQLMEVFGKNAALKNISSVKLKYLLRSPVFYKSFRSKSATLLQRGLHCKCFSLNLQEFSEQLFYRTYRQLHFSTACYYHVTYEFQSESTLYSCLMSRCLTTRFDPGINNQDCVSRLSEHELLQHLNMYLLLSL